ncbi:gas vesicle protein [Neobacillus drentensis]
MPIQHPPQSSNLLDVLEKILDKGVVIAGDIKISLADVDLLTIKIRLLVASVDKAREIGMDWWEKDPYYSSKGIMAEKERAQLQERITRLEQLVEKNTLPLPVREHPIAIKNEESSSSSFQNSATVHLDESSS